MRQFLARAAVAFILVPPPVGAVISDPPVYRITGGAGESYLLGTVHLPIRPAEFSVSLGRLIDSANAVYVEFASTPEQLDQMRADPWHGVGAALPARPEHPLGQEAQKILRDLGVPELVIQRLDNQRHLGVFSYIAHADARDEYLDQAVMRLGHAAGKPVLSLDTKAVRTHAKSLEEKSMPLEFFLLVHGDAERFREDGRRQVRRLTDAYRAGRLMNQPFTEDPGRTYRNLEWMRTLRTELHARPLFIAVGLNHLRGESGLLDGLRRAGFTCDKLLR